MSARGNHHWEDPYAQASDVSDSERDPGDGDIMYAEIQPFPLYTANAVRPARQEPLMYSPRSPRPGAYPEDAQSGRTYRVHPLDNQAPRAPYPTYTTGAPQSYTTGAPQVATRAPFGVGVMLDSSGSSEFFQESLPEVYESPQNRARRPPSTLTSSDLHLPPTKELPPKPPSHHHAMEPPMPPPRRSRRYKRDAVRTPDICYGRDASQKRADHLMVMCEQCRTPWQVPKTCVLLKCPNCKHVSSAMPAIAKGFSMKTDEYRFISPRK